MATFFGEVVFSSSRAVDDDEEDLAEQEGKEELLLQFTDAVLERMKTETRIPCTHLIITMRKPANALADCFLLQQEKEVIGTFQYQRQITSSKKGEEPSCLYQLKKQPDILICQCRDDWPRKFDFTDQLFRAINQSTLTQVTILDSCSGSEYRTEMMPSEIRFPLLRCLKSSSCTETPCCPYLESPNTVGGLGAAVLTHCQVHNLPAILYVVYAESLFIDSNTVYAFRPVLEKEIKSIAQVGKKAEERLKSLLSRPSRLDSLYT